MKGVCDMRVWYAARALGWSTKAVIALGLLAVLLVAAVPAALFVGLIMMIAGHVVGGLALFGGSILAAIAAVAIAGMSGVRHLRTMVRKAVREQGYGTQQDYRAVRLGRGEYEYN
jgi:hypothetical protein